MTAELYEKSYRNPKHFSFGRNWQRFLKTLNNQKVANAEKSLTDFLGGQAGLSGKTFVDIGCGSGLFSLAAYRLGAKKIVSVDIDEFSLACTRHLREKTGNPPHWEIVSGSALDKPFLESLGKFDIVYSWGVLHHTGNMYEALKNVSGLLESEGRMYLAIYNDNHRILEGTSRFWSGVKRMYNQSPWPVKKIMEAAYTLYYVLGLALNGRNPFTYVSDYQSLRGMNFWTDIRDWLGGYPYEYASIPTMITFFERAGFSCRKTTPARSIGCNEFLFTADQRGEPEEPEVAVVIPVYNSAATLDQCLSSVFEQTYPHIIVICVEDASTDNSLERLLAWQQKAGKDKLVLLRNERNLGVTKSLNRGLAAVQSKYIARIDADDWWDKTKIAKQVAFLEKHPEYQIVGSNYININGDIRKPVFATETDKNIKKAIIKRNPFAHSCVVYTTALTRKIGGYDERIRYGSDYDLYLRMFPYTKFYNIQEFLCFRTIQAEGISVKKQREQMLQGVKTQVKFIRKYHLSPWNYLYLAELLAVALTPKIIRDLKRALLG